VVVVVVVAVAAGYPVERATAVGTTRRRERRATR
jgi:hypothetical protein